jgi:hypothetical protein
VALALLVAVISMPQVETLLLAQGLIFITPLLQAARLPLYLLLVLILLLITLSLLVEAVLVVKAVEVVEQVATGLIN